MRTICAVVLVFEAIILGLAVPVAIQLGGHPPALAGGVWGGLALAALLLTAVQRFTWGFYAACALQAGFVVSSLLVPGLPYLGIVFVSLWIAGVVLGRRTDAMKAEYESARAEYEARQESGADAPSGRDGG
ncbi:DUF4233 domain-containing protein [Actinorugispora endophytica]|uniref:Uncharacterized protein DUF4233 n=1 Tax=Actinorugispora endophytica TaxID=1605990 RepID=A0A4R6UIZ7_9ACTN|nr:DUF4233 domain-containing protein [Actinorugispora endophytica]TDQ46878.1 uncharacterized protein DUF4233 [Actinorugispora endophytica]